MRIKWLVAALVLSGMLSALQFWALADFLYWRYVWFDVLMHFLGGLALGAFVAAFLNTWKPRWYIFLCTGVLVGWEVFEYLIGSPRETNYAFDTALDLLMGTIGMVSVYTLARFSLWRFA